ncbi:enoyl-CoA delta isomerase 2, peroxisomal-like [Amaranthus tricolor]|uniref:enoyl-CoA delta isomerase 2, peroxisomal-like n=1 Tax=Amaranthus tricolor TaxID=29722 RepID=UPI0025836493|nr:enoyl-CoA delta isomerase 2, peroxisomal-like [Amaranthus tricolor]XP_057541281.1 enoyl-CoA delta isomerase 2, peroxisomal-like [Amaranthus tricolor]XP_057541283.1 enoyl-CoA delta isomerase 2, peroxisomal-like [Amaranthus tricolor]XP_057541284.1 enoyl-CoA delta isomerase 2, peroxisomal-like [Amaranthus tricolor]XP_057541285.1 enoyl-CoA delta isomerase 2, peroxisomal-like [Amaranthus tricolor]
MCTVEKRGNIFILTLTSNENENDEHRLNPTLITSLRSVIADLKSQSLASPDTSYALITTATGKFFSNGFDLQWALSTGKPSFVSRLHFMVESFQPLVADFLSLPMPTIAAINGHASAAGFALALSHDYMLMRKDRGVLYMSEVNIGLTLPEYFNVLFREKLGWKARREILLNGRKLKGEEGVKLGVLDEVLESTEELIQRSLKLGEELVKKNWNGEVYAEIRKGLYPELCRELGSSRKPVVRPRL